MVTNFEKMKNRNKDDYLKLLNNLLDEVNEGIDGEWVKNSKIKGLNSLKGKFGDEGLELKKKIEECDRGKFCQNIYCLECSKRISKKMSDRWVRDLDEGYKLYSSTILNGLCNFDENSLRNSIKNFRRIIELIRKSNKGFYIDGLVEFEIIDVNKLKVYNRDDKLELRKIEYIKNCLEEFKLTKQYNPKNRYYLLPHIHSILRGNILDIKDYRRILRKYFNRKYDVDVKNVGFKNQTPKVGLIKWGNYICKISTSTISYRKDLYSFKTTFQPQNKMNKELFDESFRLNGGLISRMMMLYNNIKGENNKGFRIKSG